MRFRGKTYQIKIDNLAMFKLASADVHAGDLLIGKNSVPARFCAAWAAMLGVEFDGNEKAFLDGFGAKLDIYALNEEVLTALTRDGVIPDDDGAPKKKARKK